MSGVTPLIELVMLRSMSLARCANSEEESGGSDVVYSSSSYVPVPLTRSLPEIGPANRACARPLCDQSLIPVWL